MVAIVSFVAWPAWQWLRINKANAALETRTRAAYEQHPELKAAWNIAMHDAALTWDEAKEILESVGGKVDPQ